MKMRRVWVLLSTVFSVLLLAPTAYAANKAQCTLTAIEASNSGKGIDPELKDIKELTEPPLSATYSRFQFLGKTEGELEIGVAKDLTPIKDKVPAKKQAAKLTFQGEDVQSKKLQIKIELPELKFNADLKLKSGANFMIATKSGNLLAVQCSKK